MKLTDTVITTALLEGKKVARKAWGDWDTWCSVLVDGCGLDENYGHAFNVYYTWKGAVYTSSLDLEDIVANDWIVMWDN